MKYKIFLTVLLIMTVFNLDAFAKDNQDMRVYSIITDRFYNGYEANNRHVHNDKGSDTLPLGGDFQGIRGQLEYIKKMGFNTIQLSPVFEKDQNDFLGYQVKNYDKIDDVYGGDAEFKKLIKEIHSMDMKVIVDMPAVATDEFTPLQSAKLNELQKDYFKDTKFIDFDDAKNIELYKEKMTAFKKKYDVDGMSMYTVQDVNGTDIFPNNVTTIAIENDRAVSHNFNYVQKQSTTEKLANAFKTTDLEIPATFAKNELLAADNFFSKRFTKYAAESNMFPGTRIKLLMSDLFIQKQPIAMIYGTEIAMSGDELHDMHQLLDFRTDKEVVKYLETTSDIYTKYQEMFNGQMDVLKNKDGNLVYYFNTDNVDFIFNLNNMSKATKVAVEKDIVPDNKMLSGLMIGDTIHQKDGKFYMITNREEAELYAIIDERGINIWYFVAAMLIIIAFTTFIILAAKKNRKRT